MLAIVQIPLVASRHDMSRLAVYSQCI